MANRFKVECRRIIFQSQRWDEKAFDYDFKQFVLNVGGKNLKLLRGNNKNASRHSFLKYLNIKTLIMEPSEIENLYFIGKFGVFTLDLSQTQINRLNDLKAFPNLNKLIVRKGQFPLNVLKSLHSGIKVEEK